MQDFYGRQGKNMQISTKTAEKYANWFKNILFSPIKHLFCFKNKRSKSTFQPMKVGSEWVCLEVSPVDFECLLCTFMKVKMTFERAFFCYFWPPLTVFFEPFWPYLGYIGSFLDHFWTKMGSFWGHLAIILASFLGCFGVILVSFWHRFGIVFVRLWPFWPGFGTFSRKKKRVTFLLLKKKCIWNPKTLFWRGYLELSIREGTKSNGHE